MVVALVVIGPKELPNAIRTVSAVMRKVRGAAREFQNSLDEIARESGLDDVKREFDGIEDYDPDAALKRIAESDGQTVDFGEEFDPTTGNSILDGTNKVAPSATVPDSDSARGPTTAAAPAPGDDEGSAGDGGSADDGSAADGAPEGEGPAPAKAPPAATDGRA